MHANRMLLNFYRNLRWVQKRVVDEAVMDGAFDASAASRAG
jgi:hypothetical protein